MRRAYLALTRDPSIALLATHAASIAFRLVSNMVLAHLLMPHAFGLVAITTLIATGLSMLSDSGAWLALVRKGRNLNQGWLDQLWTLQALRGLSLWAAAALLGPVAAWLYGEPELTALLPVTAFSMALTGGQCLEPMVRQRNFRPALNLTLQLTTQIVASIVSIGWALIDPSPWALAFGIVAGGASTLVLSHVWSRRKPPRPRLTKQFLTEQLGLARWLSLSSGLGFFGSQIDRILFPLLFGTALFGVYGVAVTMAIIPLQLGQRWADRVYLPAIARLNEDGGDAAISQSRRLCRQAALYLAIVCGIVAGLGSPFFHALYPEQFAAAAVFVQFLAPATYLTLLVYLHRRTFLYHGMTPLELIIEASRLILFLAGLAAGWKIVGPLSAAAYIAIFVCVQVVIYGGVMAFGWARGLVDIREDFPAHLVFVIVASVLAAAEAVIRPWFGSLSALAGTSFIAGLVSVAAVVQLGIPKIPAEQQAVAAVAA